MQLVQQSVQAYGPNTLADLRREFAAQGFNIRKLAVDIMAAIGAAAARNKSCRCGRTS